MYTDSSTQWLGGLVKPQGWGAKPQAEPRSGIHAFCLDFSIYNLNRCNLYYNCFFITKCEKDFEISIIFTELIFFVDKFWSFWFTKPFEKQVNEFRSRNIYGVNSSRVQFSSVRTDHLIRAKWPSVDRGGVICIRGAACNSWSPPTLGAGNNSQDITVRTTQTLTPRVKQHYLF